MPGHAFVSRPLPEPDNMVPASVNSPELMTTSLVQPSSGVVVILHEVPVAIVAVVAVEFAVESTG